MRKSVLPAAAGLLLAGGLVAGFSPARAVDGARLQATAPGEWLAASRTYDEQRYSPLTQISGATIGRLGLTWYADIDTERGQEATPIVVDGVLYVTIAWSMVKAYDAATGRKLWEYDPKVDRAVGQIACCDVVNRGVAAWKGRIYLGALDGRLIALDARTGQVAWSVQTTDPAKPHTITGVPRIIRGKVIIGNGGAEYDARGYITAYDAATGRQLWRFFTVPGDPAKGFETPELRMAAETWTGEWWKLGGGGTVWDGMAYDVETGLLFIGVGNGTPWNQRFRSPGGGDNLFLSSIVALDPDTGRYRWHYQTTPGETWDYTAAQPIMVATLPVGGRPRRVVMQAPKNGFFYVLDARTGALLSAEKFAPADWAERVDLKTGRPVENPAARFDRTGQPAIVTPGPLGMHNWHPWSFSPRTGFVYLPVTVNNGAYGSAAELKVNDRAFNTGVDAGPAMKLYARPGAPKPGPITSYLQAWDPVRQTEVWRMTNPVYGASGTLATGADLVFSGDHAGRFAAYDARTGRQLWTTPTQAKVVAAPMTYEVGGEQYVAILVGARGLPGAQVRTSPVSANNSRLLVYKLGGNLRLPEAEFKPAQASTTLRVLNPPLLTGTNEQVIDGQTSYGRVCSGCHGAGAVADKSVPDLRYSTTLNSLPAWNAIVLDGARAGNGMASFRPLLAPGESEAIWHYVISQANKDKAAGRN
ncbi:PQQ-dependent dehydrogenase, methanol/ethanol family [Phenylobacterium kunshanense]|uniref:PQQ-dependent dehydrogenase, methanol/ethanol family n=1 Tax=Phenylobacterium kunshanense TaxID=1445034 RepID=A0A328BIC9_9CAUL|nr:PQQ-dependent dehydrogenase, methanol/ethanol family [Phenylobacterium kunshanense]RAK66231.1 PQQ-dependent dehydrogenase, methanol/ethanol family [Phenylobacterium kunshanense]